MNANDGIGFRGVGQFGAVIDTGSHAGVALARHRGSHAQLIERMPDLLGDIPSERVFRVSIVCCCSSGVANFRAAATIGNLLRDGRVARTVMAWVEHDRGTGKIHSCRGIWIARDEYRAHTEERCDQAGTYAHPSREYSAEKLRLGRGTGAHSSHCRMVEVSNGWFSHDRCFGPSVAFTDVRGSRAKGHEMNPDDGRHLGAVAPTSWWSRHRKWVLSLGGVLVLAAGAIVAFDVVSRPSPAHPSAPAQPPKATHNSSVPSPAANPPTTPPIPADLATAFAELQAGLHAQIGVVLSPVGAGPDSQVTLGQWTHGPAWSTSKVPLVIAAMRQQHTDQPTEQMIAAITESDNKAAESIWEGLDSDPVAAASKVDAVLRDAGDRITNVQSKQVRPPYTAFGQTDWSLTNQALFLSTAACDPHNKPVLDLMGKVESEQQWGLGVIPKTEIKGGWGPSESQRYLVRQIGILPTLKGLTVVAMAAEPDSGTFPDGTHNLTKIAQWLQDHLDALPAGQCKP